MNILADDIIELRVPSKPEYVSVVRSLVADLAERVALPQSAVEDVRVAVSEACANVVCHAYSPVENGSADIVLRCSAEGGCIKMEVSDTGRGFLGDTPKRNGLGLVLIHALMDYVSLDTVPGKGTVLRMTKTSRR